MFRQPDPQQAAGAVNTPANGISSAEAWAHVDALSMCLKLFAYLTDAQDTSMLENKYAAVGQAERWFISVVRIEDSLLQLHDTPFFYLCTRAAANSMGVVLQDTRSSLLLQCHSVQIACALAKVVTEYAKQMRKRHDIEGGLEKVRAEITAAGLPSSLINFTEAAWQEVQQLNINSCQQQQPQPQRFKHRQKARQHLHQQWEEHADRCVTAALLIEQLLSAWDVISNSLVRLSTLDKVLPSLIAMATTAPTILKQARHRDCCCCSSSSIDSPDLLPYDQQVRKVAATAVCMASAIAARMTLNPKQPKTLEEQQQWQQILQAEKLPDLLLQLVAHHTGKLHKMFNGLSHALHVNHAAVDSGLIDQQQQQRHGDLPLAQCGVPPCHLALARSIGLGCYVVEEMVWSNDIQEIVDAYAITLATLHYVVQARHNAAQLSSSSSNDNSGHDTRQQQPEQQQQPGVIHSVVPIRLLVPLIKVLIEALLLPPASNLAVHCSTLALIKLLVATAATPAAAAAAPEEAEEAPLIAALWPQLPPELAAGLLQPVITQLPQAVIYGLRQSNHHQQQQQHQQSLKQQAEAGSQRLALLHDYGCLLLAVCQAVEPKHIAAALQSQPEVDILISLAAIEAVIRAQVFHLAPGLGEQQQLQAQLLQQQWPNVYSNCNVGSDSMSFSGVWDITQHPPAHAPLLMLPFVYKFVQSMLTVFPLPAPQLQRSKLLSFKTSVRLCTLLTTALKVGKCAIAAALPDQHEAVLREAMSNAMSIFVFASCWTEQQASSCMSDSCAEVLAQTMPVGLMLRALQACTCSSLSWVFRYEARASAVATILPDPLAASANRLHVDGMTPISLQWLQAALLRCEHAFERLLNSSYDPSLAAAGAQDTAAAQNPALNQQPNSLSSGMPCCEQLLLQRSMQIRAALMSAQESLLSSTNVDAPVAPAAVEGGAKKGAGVASNTWTKEGDHVSLTASHCSALVCDLADDAGSCFPLNFWCNNSGCTNLTKLSEWQLVCGKACVCAGCEVARYCSRNCQLQHQKLHKHLCKSLRA